jgi:hypothetical protein
VSVRGFDLGLTEEDERALRDARSRPFEVDGDLALKLIADWSPLVDEAVRRRPLFRGAPFTLPGHQDDPAR